MQGQAYVQIWLFIKCLGNDVLSESVGSLKKFNVKRPFCNLLAEQTFRVCSILNSDFSIALMIKTKKFRYYGKAKGRK